MDVYPSSHSKQRGKIVCENDQDRGEKSDPALDDPPRPVRGRPRSLVADESDWRTAWLLDTLRRCARASAVTSNYAVKSLRRLASFAGRLFGRSITKWGRLSVRQNQRRRTKPQISSKEDGGWAARSCSTLSPAPITVTNGPTGSPAAILKPPAPHRRIRPPLTPSKGDR